MNTTPTLSYAGVWVPIDSSYLNQTNLGNLAGPFTSLIPLGVSGQNGIVISGWGYSGWNPTITTPEKVTLAILAPNADGALDVATSKYIADPVINGSGSVVVADFNGDGKPDIVLPAHNESPHAAMAGTTYMSAPDGTYTKVALPGVTTAHGAELAYINGKPLVVTATLEKGDKSPIFTFSNGQWIETIPSSLGGMSGTLAAFGPQSSYEIVHGEIPSYDATSGIWNNRKILVHDFNPVTFQSSSTPIQTITPYLSTLPQFSLYASEWGVNETHTYRVWSLDVNNDNNPDVLAGESMWKSTTNDWPSALQVLINRGDGTFREATAGLSPIAGAAIDELDYSPTFIDVDHSGYKDALMFGAWCSTGSTRQSNFLLLNDGSGQLHVALHDQFVSLGHQAIAFNNTVKGPYANDFTDTTGTMPKFIGVPQPDGTINYVAVVATLANENGLFHSEYAFVNVPLSYNPTTDFTQGITIADRNQSKLMRTWAGNDIFKDTNANTSASINGGLGTDTSVYSGKAADYKLTHNSDGSMVLKGAAFTDQLTNIERLQFSDKTLAIDMGTTQSGGKAVLLIGAVLGKSSLTDKSMVGNLLKFFDTGISLHDAADLLVKSGAIDGFAGGTGTDKFVNLIYHAVTGQTATADITSGFASLIGGAYSKTDFLASAAEHPINQTNVGLVGLQQNGLEYS